MRPAFAWLLLLAVAASARAETIPPVRVLDETGARVAGAMVTAGRGDPAQLTTVFTGEDGRAQAIAAGGEGATGLRVQRIGYRDLRLAEPPIGSAATFALERERDPAALVVQRPIGQMQREGTPFAPRLGVSICGAFSIPMACSPPPWGTLVAVDLATGDERWEIRFGSTRGQAPFSFWVEIGMPSIGGPLVTASGVGFIGAAMDGSLRAFYVETRETLARGRLPAPGRATQVACRLRSDFRPHLVIAAGAPGERGSEQGGVRVASAPPG